MKMARLKYILAVVLLCIGLACAISPASAELRAAENKTNSEIGSTKFREWLNNTTPFISAFAATPRNNEEPFIFKIADATFAIPRNFIASNRLPPNRSRMDGGMHLTMLWPGLEPLDQENGQEFRKAGWGRKIRGLLIQKGTQLFGLELLGRYLKDANGAEFVKTVQNGKLYKKSQLIHGYDLYLFKNNLFTVCTRANQFEFKTNEYCKRHIKIAPGVALSYSFSHDYVDILPDMEMQIRNLFKSFVVDETNR